MAVGFCVLKGFNFLVSVGGRRYLRLLASLVLYSAVALSRSLGSQVNPVALVHVNLRGVYLAPVDLRIL
jgi:hypothetical protein